MPPCAVCGTIVRRRRHAWVQKLLGKRGDGGIIPSSAQTDKTVIALVCDSPSLRMVPLMRDVMNGGDKARAGPRPR